MSATTVNFLTEPLSTPVGQPLRVAVYSRLARGIRTGALLPGSPLPKEIELGAFLGVSRTVIREALMLLEEDGLIVTRRGVGRFVTQSLPHVGLEEFQPFERLLAEPGRGVGVRPLEFTIQPTTDFISVGLSIDSEANTWFRESLLEMNGEPIALVQEHLPAGKYLSDINQSISDNLHTAVEGSGTVLSGLIERCGSVFSSGMCRVTTGVAGPTRAKHLQIQPTDPVLILIQTAKYLGTPVYLAKCVVTPEVGHLSIVQSSSN